MTTRLSLEQIQATAAYDPAIAQLLEPLLVDETVYPDPATLSETAWSEIETALSLSDWSDAELATGRDHLFAALNNAWPAPSQDLLAQLQSQFGASLPSDWLQTISDRAQELTQAGLSPLEQLVNCVQPLLSDWSLDDLQVFARPVAFAMRSAPAATTTNKPWTELSPVEQARYTLQVAQSALQMASHADESSES